MGVGCQSRRVCFGAKPDKGFLDKKISPYPEVVRGRDRELTTRPRRELVAGEQRESWWLESRERVGGWRAERELVAGDQQRSGGWTRERSWDWTRERSWGWTGERRTAEVGVEERRGSQHQTPSREARRQDRVQWRRVSRCLIPVALWNFR